MSGRAKRIEGMALTYYISSEGKRGQKLFIDDEDMLYSIDLLRQHNTKRNLKFYGYILLPTKYSCLVETYRNILSKSMHKINSSYANYFNRRHNRRNKLFKDRYSCFIIDKKNYLAEVSCYLHLLPKKDGVIESPFQYKWSSLPGYINKEKRVDWIDYDSILNLFNGKSHEASINYKNYIKNNLKKQTASPFENLKGSIILGSEDFKKEVLKNQHLNKIGHPRDENILAKKIIGLATQPPSWSSLKVKRKKLNQTTLFRNATIYFLKKYTDLSNQQISIYFQSLKQSSISQMSRRFRHAMEKDNKIKQTTKRLEKKINELILEFVPK